MEVRRRTGLWKRLVPVIGLILIAGCAGTGGPRESIRFSAKMTPKFVKGFPGQTVELTRFVLEGKSIDEWTEALETINALRAAYPPTLETFYNKNMELRKKTCPDSAFNIISQDPNSILYELRTKNCSFFPDQHSLTRVMYGKTNVWVLIYTNTVAELPTDKREEWIRYLSQANLVTEN